MKTTSPVIISTSPRLNDEQLRDAFAISPEHKLYRAIVQRIEDHMRDRMECASGFATGNNALGMAACNGGWDILNTLLADLDTRVKQASG